MTTNPFQGLKRRADAMETFKPKPKKQTAKADLLDLYVLKAEDGYLASIKQGFRKLNQEQFPSVLEFSDQIEKSLKFPLRIGQELQNWLLEEHKISTERFPLAKDGGI